MRNRKHERGSAEVETPGMRDRKHERGPVKVEVTCVRNRKSEQDAAQGRALNTETKDIN